MENETGIAILNAFNHVRQTGQAVRKTARMYGIPESTLRWRIAHDNVTKTETGRPGIFSPREERELADHCKRMARLGYGLCRWQVIEIAKNMCIATGREVEPKKDWFYGFIKRFPDISIQKPKKRQIARVRGTADENMRRYFEELGALMTKHNFLNKPESIWNVDETGITLDHSPPKIVAGKGENSFAVTAGKSATTTVIAAGSALGETIPPFVIFKGHRLIANLIQGCLPGTRFTTTSSGWSTSETFRDFLQNHFIPLVSVRPCLLLYDGHSTHITTEVIKIAIHNQIHLFVLPPHSSHQLQPLDVGIFSPFKAALSSECHKLAHTHVGRQITRDDLPNLIGAAYKSSFTVSNLMSAFRKTGIVPFDPRAVATKPESSSFTTPRRPQSRKERSHIRNVKILFKEVDTEINSQLDKELQSASKARKFIVPPHGAAVTDMEFLKKLSEKEQNSNSKKMTDKLAKRKLFNEKQTTKRSKQSCSKNKENQPTENSDWSTFYNPDSCSDVEDDGETCCVCKSMVPPTFSSITTIDILNWAKCDSCSAWVHLKYCTSIRSVAYGEGFTCPKC